MLWLQSAHSSSLFMMADHVHEQAVLGRDRWWLLPGFVGSLALMQHCSSRHVNKIIVVQIDHMDLLTKGCQVGSFLIYSWIEQPHKQQIIQETMDLLVQKVLVPAAGMDLVEPEAGRQPPEPSVHARLGKLPLPACTYHTCNTMASGTLAGLHLSRTWVAGPVHEVMEAVGSVGLLQQLRLHRQALSSGGGSSCVGSFSGGGQRRQAFLGRLKMPQLLQMQIMCTKYGVCTNTMPMAQTTIQSMLQYCGLVVSNSVVAEAVLHSWECTT